MRKMYDWMMRMAESPRAPWALGVVSFLESSIFPIPPDVMLLPMCLANRSKAFWYATVATVASVLGGIAGYLIGYYLFEIIGQPILKLYGYTNKFDTVTQWFRDWGVWILIAKGWTPFPYKVLTIMSGVAKMDPVQFIIASIVARSMRFYLVAGLLYFFGEPIRDFIEKRLTLLTTLFLIALIGGFVAVKFLF
ncbi:MAG: YqaA family protein [Hyphomicrobiaceae bacterium]